MRPLLTGISTIALLLCPALRSATGEELQWVHSSQRSSASTQQAPARSTPQVEVRKPAAKQPTFRQPQSFKQPASAQPLEAVAANQAPRISDSRVRGAKPTRQRANPRPPEPTIERPVSLGSIARQVAPTQYELPLGEEIPPGEYEQEYEQSEPSYFGPGYEVGCGCPEPTCGCAGPCGCGDSCCLGEPGCAVGCGDGCGGCGDACGCGDCCDDCAPWPQALFGCDERGCVPVLWVPPIKEVTFFGGVQGFKGPLDGDGDGGNFGFHEGFNIGGKMAWLPWPGLGYQFGYQATQNQLNGNSNLGTNDSFSQHFLTTGLFHRQPMGLNYGVVWDMLRDERQDAADYGQIRGEVSLRNRPNRELGFTFALNSNDNQINSTRYQAADQYLFFYRLLGREGGNCRAFAGFTGQSDGVLGSDFHLPLNNRWSLEGNWAYMIPDSGRNGSGADDEAWNISMQLVWHYGCRAKSWHNRPYRPMFNVADNASLIVVE